MRSAWLGLGVFLVFMLTGISALAQDEHASVGSDSGVQMIARTTQAVDYRRDDHTDVDLTGTNLMPGVTGKAKIINKRGLTDIHVDIENLRSANALDAPQVDGARQPAQAAQQRAQQAETQQQQLRQQLRDQLNQILETRDTARGLIVSMPDVLFDTGSATLKATARERLAKVSGILIAHPDIRVEVDGYTDSTGDPSFNEQLSQQRAASVQSYLTQQGVPGGAISIHGLGQANPIASNDSAAGQQQNRRVELVVSGESIGNQEAPGR
jgi:outer membrane protein OmpA-like peptidoglycan-associated protein